MIFKKSFWTKSVHSWSIYKTFISFHRKCFKTYLISHLSLTQKYKEKRKSFKKADQNISDKWRNVIQMRSSFFCDVLCRLRYGVQNKMVGGGMVLSSVCIHVIAEHSSNPCYSNLPLTPPLGAFMPGPVFRALYDTLPEHPGSFSPVLHAVVLCPSDCCGMPVPLDSNTCAS